MSSRNLDWINCIASVHNLTCKCYHPLLHTVQEIFKQEPEIKEKCLTTGEKDHTGGDDIFGEGELEHLFAGDMEEKDGADAATG